MNVPKITPPFSEKDKQDIFAFTEYVIESGRPIDRTFSNFTHDEAIALLLPSNGFQITETEFGLALARGELPFEEVDEHGNVLKITY
jgi:hypothetical protein